MPEYEITIRRSNVLSGQAGQLRKHTAEAQSEAAARTECESELATIIDGIYAKALTVVPEWVARQVADAEISEIVSIEEVKVN